MTVLLIFPWIIRSCSHGWITTANYYMLGIFKKEFPCILQSLQEAVVRGDMKKVEVTAHTIKGMLTNVFFARAAASAMRLECIGRQRNTDGLQEELASFEPRAEALALAELEAFCRETIR